MARYMARPVEPEQVEAEQYDGTNARAILALLGGDRCAEVTPQKVTAAGRGMRDGIVIRVFGGTSVAGVGDWIVRLSDGEFRRHSATEFADKYEAVQ